MADQPEDRIKALAEAEARLGEFAGDLPVLEGEDDKLAFFFRADVKLLLASKQAVERENEALRAALEPFAKMYDESVKPWAGTDMPREPRPDEREAWGFNGADLLWGDFRRARALLTPAGREGGEAPCTV